MNSFILLVHHDRHTDDKHYLFPNTEEGKEKAISLMEATFPEYEYNRQYGDFCYYVGDDYYISYEEISLEA